MNSGERKTDLKLVLEIDFHTDGDFWPTAEKLIEPQSPFYNGAVKEFQVLSEPGDEYYGIILVCEGRQDLTMVPAF